MRIEGDESGCEGSEERNKNRQKAEKLELWM
jgi:hypothetical protein